MINNKLVVEFFKVTTKYIVNFFFSLLLEKREVPITTARPRQLHTPGHEYPGLSGTGPVGEPSKSDIKVAAARLHTAELLNELTERACAYNI